MTIRAIHFRAGFCGTRTRRVIECDRCHLQTSLGRSPDRRWLAYSDGKEGLKHKCPRCINK